MDLSERLTTAATDATEPAAGAWSAMALDFAARHATLLVLAGAALVVAGFFAPWMHGSGPFEYRSFSGADFARLVRNFEITSTTATSSAQVRGSAIALYLVPALAANAVTLRLVALAGIWRQWSAWCARLAAVYTLAMLALILLMSLAPLNDFAPSVGMPSWGFAVVVAGAAMMLAPGFAGRRR